MVQQPPTPHHGIQDGRGYQQPPVQAYGQAPYRTYSNAPRYATSKGYYGHRRRRSFLSELFDD